MTEYPEYIEYRGYTICVFRGYGSTYSWSIEEIENSPCEIGYERSCDAISDAQQWIDDHE